MKRDKQENHPLSSKSPCQEPEVDIIFSSDKNCEDGLKYFVRIPGVWEN